MWENAAKAAQDAQKSALEAAEHYKKAAEEAAENAKKAAEEAAENATKGVTSITGEWQHGTRLSISSSWSLFCLPLRDSRTADDDLTHISSLGRTRPL